MSHQPESEAEHRPTGPPAAGFWALVASSGLSNVADGLFKLALPLAALTFTRSPALVAGLELVRSLPWLVLALHAGALADRCDRRRTLQLANTARAVLLVVLALAVGLDLGGLWLLYLVAVGTGVAEVFYDTSAQSLLPALVSRDRLGWANGRLQAVEIGGQSFVGPPLAGVLVAVSLALAFWVPAALWLVAVALLVWVRGSFRPVRSGEATSLAADIGVGLRFLGGQPLLRLFAVMVGVGNLSAAAAGALLVLYAVGESSVLGLSEAGFGALSVVIAVGSMGGAAITSALERRLGRARALQLSVVGMALFVGAPALFDRVAPLAVSLLVGGASIMVWNVITVSFRQRITPDELLGRVNSVYRLVAWGTMPVGAGIGGLLGEWLGIRPVFALMGLISLALLAPAMTLTDARLDEASPAAPGRL